jgi:hypothetical protein
MLPAQAQMELEQAAPRVPERPAPMQRAQAQTELEQPAPMQPERSGQRPPARGHRVLARARARSAQGWATRPQRRTSWPARDHPEVRALPSPAPP